MDGTGVTNDLRTPRRWARPWVPARFLDVAFFADVVVLLAMFSRERQASLPREGRPPHREAALRQALAVVREQLILQGRGAGEDAIMKALDPKLPRRLVRKARAICRRHDEERHARRRAAKRVTIVAARSGVLGSMDAMQAGRVEGRRVMAEQLVDVASARTLEAMVTERLDGVEVAALLEGLAAADRLPLAVLVEKGSENVNPDVAAVCASHWPVLVRNVPHTPQHNPWSEPKHRNVREESGLRKNTVLRLVDNAARLFARALGVLDDGRLRARHGFVTNAVRDRLGRQRYTPAQREALCTPAEAARNAARQGCVRARDRPGAERNAVLGVL